MDNNRIEGAKHEIKGAVREGISKLTGNKAGELAGKVEKNAGKAQRKLGEAADNARQQGNKHS